MSDPKLEKIYIHPFPQNCKECPLYQEETFIFGLIRTGRFFCHGLDHEYAFQYKPTCSSDIYDSYRLPSCPLVKWDWKKINEREIKE